MKPLRTLTIAVAAAIVLALVGCRKLSPEDQAALRIAKAKFIQGVFKHANRELSDPDIVIEPVDEPLEFKLAKILVYDYKDSPDMLEVSAGLLNTACEIEDQVGTSLAKDKGYLDNVLKVAAFSMEVRNRSWSDTSEKLYLKFLDSSTGAVALIKQTAGKLTACRSRDTLAVVEQFKIGLREAIARHPENLKPFAEERPPSPTLRAAMDRLQKAL